MQNYRVKVKLERIVTTYDWLYVKAADERGARQEALESAEAAYPEYDDASVTKIELNHDGSDE